MKRAAFIISILFTLICQSIDAQISGPETINFSIADNTNLGPTAIDGEGGSTNITGVQINIVAIDASGNPTGVDLIYNVSDFGFGATGEEGISISNDPATTAWRGIKITSDDGSEFDFNGFESWNFAGVGEVTLNVRGYKNGVATGSGPTPITTSEFADRKEHVAGDFPDADFGDVDEVRIIAATDFFGTFDVFVFGAVAVANVAPTLTTFTSFVETTSEDVAVEITFAEIAAQGDEADSDGTVDAFVVQAVSSGTLMINGGPYLAGFNEEITAASSASWTPDANANGTLNAFTVKAKDNGSSLSSTAIQATVSVTAVNDEPSFTKGANETVLEDAGAQTVNNWATSLNKGASNESGQTLSFAVTNNNNALFSTQPAVDASGNLTYTPAANANGAATVDVILSDDGGTTNSGDDTFTTQQFTITVIAVNDEPSFTKGANQEVDKNSGAQTVSGWATSLNKGATDESGQTLSFAVTNNNNSLFSAQPAIDASGNLTFTPAADATGVATVTVVLSDDGGTANGGDDEFAAQQFSITVVDPATAPSISTNAASSIEVATATLNGNVTSDGGAAIIERGFVYSKTADDDTPTVAEANESTVFKVVVSGTTGTFNEVRTGLTSNTGYSFIAYAINSEGTTEGSVQTFTTASPTIAFNSTSSNGAESVSSANLPVDLSVVSATTVTVDYTVTGTATGNGTDYTLANGTLTITAGNTSTNITIASIVEDALDEVDETVIVTLSNPANATLGTNMVHTYTITDNDDAPAVSFELTTDGQSESESGQDIQVSLSAISSKTVTVEYTVGGTATGSGTDHSTASGTLTFNPGDQNLTLAIVGIVDDALDEDNETIILTLSNPSNASLGTNTVHTYTINDNDPEPTVTFTTTSRSGAESVNSVDMEVSLSAASGKEVTVDYAVTGTATGSGTDYTLVNGTLTITSGNTTKNITAGIVDDAIGEVDETIVVTLSNPGNATLGTNTIFTYTIQNDDNTPPTFTSTAITSVNVGEQYSYEVTTNDVDGDAVTVTATTKPTWLTLTAGMTLSGTSPAEAGDHAVVLKADDGNGGTAEQSFTIKVNTPPTFTSDPVTSLNPGEVYAYEITTSDPDGDPVTVTTPTLPGWLSLSVESRVGDQVTTFARNSDGIFTFFQPAGVAIDASGNIYVADVSRNVISKITSDGVVSTLAGSGARTSVDGTGTAASFDGPVGIAVDASGNVYVGESDKIRKITPEGVVTTLAGSDAVGYADGTGIEARFFAINDIEVDASGNLYVADRNNNRIRKVTPEGVVTTFAGSGSSGTSDGTGTAAQFYQPSGLVLDDEGNLYVADSRNNLIRKITSEGVVTTVAGSGSFASTDGTGTGASFSYPSGIALDAVGNLYISDLFGHKIRKITPQGVVTTVAGSGTEGSADGIGTAASFKEPNDLAIDASGNIYVADEFNARIRRINAIRDYALTGNSTGQAGDHAVVLKADDGNGGTDEQSFTVNVINRAPTFTSDPVTSLNPGEVYAYEITTSDPDGDPVTVTTPTLPGWLSLSVESRVGDQVTTFARNSDGIFTFFQPTGVAIDASGNIYVADVSRNVISKITSDGVVSTLAGSGARTSVDGTGTAASFDGPVGIAVDASGNVYVGESDKIRKITPEGVVTTLAGSDAVGYADGTGSEARFFAINDIEVDASGNLYVADRNNNRIRKVTPEGVVTTFAGSGQGSADGVGTAAQFYQPSGLVLDDEGNLYVADSRNNLIRKITSEGVVTTVAGSGSFASTDGTGTGASFSYPSGIALDAIGNLYISELFGHKIRKITPQGVVTTVAGSGTEGSADGIGTAASFKEPNDLAIDASGNIYVADEFNARIRRINAIRDYALTGNSTGQAGDHAVVLKADDGNGGTDEQSFTVSILNAAPTDIALDVSSIDENNAVNQKIGDLSTTDSDSNDSHTYSLVSGTGDTDNGKFSINGAGLLASESFNHEADESFSVRIQTNDGKGGTFQKAFTITINDVNEAPFEIALSNNEIDETDDTNVLIGTMSSMDPDDGETFTYSLVEGDGDANNLLFTFNNNELRNQAAINFESSATLSIRVRVTDSEGLTFDKAFTITVKDVAQEDNKFNDPVTAANKPKNFFTPNGDGTNDTWVIEDILDNPINEVKVYSQAGKLVFSQRNYENDWDGTFDGEPIPPGTYYYEINIYNGESIIRGFLTILRN